MEQLKLKYILDFDKILKKIEKGEGTIGLLLNDKEMYNNLTSASKQLDLLIEDMKKHPKRYVTFSLLGGRRTAFEVKTRCLIGISISSIKILIKHIKLALNLFQTNVLAFVFIKNMEHYRYVV